jgi:hypothetical protein
MRFPFPGDWLTPFPVAEGEPVSDQMHYAGLNLGLRENRGDGEILSKVGYEELAHPWFETG